MHPHPDALSQRPETRIQTRVVDRLNRLDVHAIGEGHLGLFREPFDRVAHIHGLRLWPLDGLTIWAFEDPAGGVRGRLMDVVAHLQGGHITLSDTGLAYMVRDHGQMLALLLPPHPRRLKLTEANFKIVPHREERGYIPEAWPRGLVVRVIRSWLHSVVIVDEKYLLARLARA